MIYECLYEMCGHTEEDDSKAPEKWGGKGWPPFDRMRRSCPECGAAMAPKIHPYKDVTDLYEAFSDCVNAGDCMLHGQYAPDCENGHLKPKCLRFVFEKVEILEAKVDGMNARQNASIPGSLLEESK